MTTSARALRPLLGVARREGASVEEILRRAELEPRAVEDPDARVAVASYLDAFRATEELCGLEAFGARIGRLLDPSSLGALGYLTECCATVGAAFEAFRRFERLFCDALRVQLTSTANQAEVAYYLDGQPYYGPFYEMMITHHLEIIRRAAGTADASVRIMLPHRASRGLQQILGNVPVTQGPVPAITCAAAAMDLRMPGSNAVLCRILDECVSFELSRLPDRRGLRARLDEVLQTLMPEGDVNLSAIARKLGMSPRTLQRRLGDAELTFGEVVDDARRWNAFRLLMGSHLPIGAIALQLGFSDSTAFHRAFRRWTGESATTVRRRLQSRAGALAPVV